MKNPSHNLLRNRSAFPHFRGEGKKRYKGEGWLLRSCLKNPARPLKSRKGIRFLQVKTSRPRMRLAIGFFQPFNADVRIDLRGGKARVPEQFFDRVQICPRV